MLLSLKCLLRKPIVTFCFLVLLTSVTATLLIGVTLTFITARGYADAEKEYVTKITLSKKQDSAIDFSQAAMTFADSIRQRSVLKSELAPFISSKYVKEVSEQFFVPVSQLSLRSYDAVKGATHNVGTVARITEIETVNLTADKRFNLPDRLTVVYYEPLYTFYGSIFSESVMVFFDYDSMKEQYPDIKMPSETIREILEVGKTYMIKADTLFFAMGNEPWSFIKNKDIVPTETWERLNKLEHVLNCGTYAPERDRFVQLDVSTAEEAENHPLVKRAETYQYNFVNWPGGSMHMSMQLVQDLKNLEPFYNEDYVLTQGRFFTEDEIKNGEPVIIISEDTLKFSTLDIGDKVEIMLNQKNEFITEYKEYEIVGAFKANTTYATLTDSALGQSTSDDRTVYNVGQQYTFNPYVYDYYGKEYVEILQKSGNMIYLPEASIKNDPLIETYVADNRITDENGEPLVMLDDFYFVLEKNKDIEAFIEELQSSDYIRENLDISYADQGYSKAIENLEQLKVTSAVVIFTAFMVTITSVAFLMLLFVSRRSHDVIVMMAMGSKKRNILGMLAWGIVVMFIVSCATGLIAGGRLVGSVIDSVVSPLYVAEEFPQFALNPPPIIQPQLNTYVPEMVYIITVLILMAVLAAAFAVSVRGKLKHKPSEALAEALK